MKRFATLALAGSIQLVALADNPVSVYPPPAAKPATSMSQSLTSVVQSAATTLPPAPVMSSTPSWGSPTVLPTTAVTSGCTTAVPCGDPATCGTVRPYFNLFAPRSECGVARGTCLDRLKEWICYRPTPGGLGFRPAAWNAPLRTYFPCKPTCGTGGCGPTGCGVGVAGGTNCGPVTLPVKRLDAGCETPACRPRVVYMPLTARSEMPVVGCDARPMRPRLFERILRLFTPRWSREYVDYSCQPTVAPTTSPATTPTVWTTPAPTVWSSPSIPSVAPTAMPGSLVPPLSVTPIYGPTPTGAKMTGKEIHQSPAQPFTNP